MSVPAIDIISAEISFVGNLVGTYNDLAELMTLPAEGRVTLHASAYPLDAINDAMDDLDGGRLHGRGIPHSLSGHARCLPNRTCKP